MPKVNRPVEYIEIPGFPGYRAGSDGTIWTCWKSLRGVSEWYESGSWALLKPERRREDLRGRYNLRSLDGKLVRKYGSYFVLLSFVGPKPDGCEVCHNNGDCTDDSANNLRCGTPQSNLEDKISHGTVVKGVDVHTAKLDEDDVREIRVLRHSGMSLRSIAKMFGVTQTLVSLIYKRKVWKHVK